MALCHLFTWGYVVACFNKSGCVLQPSDFRQNIFSPTLCQDSVLGYIAGNKADTVPSIWASRVA